ncbi:MAG: tetratricopeptide repeat protein [Candidatus Magnetominusculus sp. LBB02]|nr:tetratricopeptide repeat protein [Candidatus Magnetominusculus sp. LBB02]
MDRQRRLIYLIILMLTAATFVCYLPLRYNEFVTYDDYDYILKNTQIHSGLNVENIKWALTSSYFSYWHPLTWISHMIDIELFGLNPKGHHMISLFFHIANTVLLFAALRLMTGRLWQSAFVAALFALHPMAVDSVAWAAERKNVLSTFFWFLLFIFYYYYARRPALWRYLAVFGTLALGLMSKPMLVTVPFLLLLLDYWPLGRLKAGKHIGLIIEKVPLMLLSVLSLLLTTIPRLRVGKIIPHDSVSVGAWTGRAVNSYTGYLIHMISPAKLTVLYPFIWEWPWWQTALSAAFLLSVSVAAVAAFKKYPYLFVGWFWYLGTMVPVIQVFLVNISPMADRFTYVPLIGMFIITAWGMGDMSKKTSSANAVYLTAALSILAVLGGFTWRQVGYWRDSGTLYRHAIDVTQGNYMAYNNYGGYLESNGKLDEAMVQFEKGLQITPDNEELSYNKGHLLILMGKGKEAEGYILRSARIWYKGDSANFYKRLSASLLSEGKYAESLEYITKLLLINPKDTDDHKLLSEALTGLKRYTEALAAIEKGISLSPKDADLYYRKGMILMKMGQTEAAEAAFRQSSALKHP